MHVYKLINLCTCVCRSYTSGCRQNAEEGEKKGGRKEGKKTGGSGEKERGLEEGFGERGKKGGRKEERGRRKYMDLFKNTAISESGPFIRCFTKIRRKTLLDVEGTEERIPQGYNRKQKQTERPMDKHLWMKRRGCKGRQTESRNIA